MDDDDDDVFFCVCVCTMTFCGREERRQSMHVRKDSFHLALLILISIHCVRFVVTCTCGCLSNKEREGEYFVKKSNTGFVSMSLFSHTLFFAA